VTSRASAAQSKLIDKALAASTSGASLSDINHVVILMQENRSFDHYFGVMSGVRGYSDSNVLQQTVGGAQYPVFDQFGYQPGAGVSASGYMQPFHLINDPPTENGETTNDIAHDWGTQHASWNNGAMDAFMTAHLSSDGATNGPVTMGYYTDNELGFYYALANAFTACDGYFCSVLGPTDPNRLMGMSASIDPNGTNGGPVVVTFSDRVAEYGSLSWETMPEALLKAGVSWKVYNDPTGLTSSAAYVALVQTAASLPVLLFAILAGTVGDLVDRRKFLLVTQTLMLAAAAALGGLAIAGLVTPWTLLALLFGVGVGQALTSPTWQTLQPELVAPAERTQAISLGAVNQNLARAVGPAIGGALPAATSAGDVFLINAATFAAVIAVIAAWRGGARPASALPQEHVGDAIRAGGRYVAASPALRAILIRAALFIFFAAAIWALLPLTAESVLHLGSGGYGLLLGTVGIGAVAGAALPPRLRGRLTPTALLAAGSVGMAIVAVLMALVHVTVVIAIALAGGGICWILALSTLSSMYQLSLPGWVKRAACRST